MWFRYGLKAQKLLAQGVLAYVLESLHSEMFEGCGYAILFV